MPNAIKPIPPQPSLVLAEHLRHEGHKFTFVRQTLRFPNGTEGSREYLLHPGGAVAVPLTPEGDYLCLRQYRFAIGRYIYEFPAGTLEPDEPPHLTVKRELAEETGYSAATWHDLGQFYLAPGYCDEMLYTYLAQDLTRLPNPPAGDEDEDIELVALSPAAMAELVATTEEVDAKTIACFYRAERVRQARR